MAYSCDQAVEVRSKEEEDALASYFPATLLAAIGRTMYLVRYQTRYTEGRASLLTAVVEESDIRPAPPQIRVPSFGIDDRVDAYVDGGWCSGRVTKKVESMYNVGLDDGNGDEVFCSIYRLRAHLDWEDGIWVSSVDSLLNGDDVKELEGNC